MKNIFLPFFFLISFTVCAQKEIKTTDELRVTGQVKQELTVSLTDLNKSAAKKINDVVITNHLGEPKGTAKNLKAVLVKDILSKAEFKAENPKLLSEFYLTFTATDGYKVVYSWNEIFNSPTGDNIYLVVEKDGKKLKDMEDRLLLITPTDFKTGRRYIKGLSKIVVDKAD